MRITFSDLDGVGKPNVQPLGNFPNWTVVYIQVFGPNTLRIGPSAVRLANGEGLQLTASDPVKPGWDWIGPLYGVASAPGTVVEIDWPGSEV
ncbi:MAG: hypothetical protein ABSA41_12540 [Terriglobia bacterium]|jgi:hypothetical protein